MSTLGAAFLDELVKLDRAAALEGEAVRFIFRPRDPVDKDRALTRVRPGMAGIPDRGAGVSPIDPEVCWPLSDPTLLGESSELISSDKSAPSAIG